MCGIAAIYQLQATVDLTDRIKRMTDTMFHRGPDYGEVTNFGRVALGHRRLKIIDLSENANQPFYSECGNYAIVFNGEIYNYRFLKKELEERGARFKTTSDTEVLLTAYQSYGEACLHKLNGIFAFCIFDQEKDILFGARDHLGVKPLYYCSEAETFIFASEIKAFFEGGIVPKVNFKRIPEFLQFGHIAGEETMFSGIFRLLPGHFFKITKGKFIRNRYYSNFPHVRSNLSYAEARDSVKERLEEAVKLQMVSDVPVGTMCSGGIDSSYVTAQSVVTQPNTKAYCVKVPFKGYDEEKYAKLAAKASGIQLHTLTLDLEAAIALLPSLIWLHDEPLRHPNSIPIFQISDLARRDVTVLLSGEGADEIFAGYGSYRAIQRLNKMRIVPRSLNPILRFLSRKTGKGKELVNAHRFPNWATRLIYLRSFLSEPESIKLFAKNKLDLTYRQGFMQDCLATAGSDLVNALLYYDQGTHLQTLLDRQDKMCMGTSIESRVPLLDWELVSLVNSLPSEYKLGETTKKIFRDIARENLPEEIFNRPKYPFAVPILRMYLDTRAGKNYLLQDLRKSFLFEGQYLNKKMWERILMGFLKGDEYYAPLIWNVINLDLWYKIFISRELQPDQNCLTCYQSDFKPVHL